MTRFEQSRNEKLLSLYASWVVSSPSDRTPTNNKGTASYLDLGPRRKWFATPDTSVAAVLDPYNRYLEVNAWRWAYELVEHGVCIVEHSPFGFSAAILKTLPVKKVVFFDTHAEMRKEEGGRIIIPYSSISYLSVEREEVLSGGAHIDNFIDYGLPNDQMLKAEFPHIWKGLMAIRGEVRRASQRVLSQCFEQRGIEGAEIEALIPPTL